MSTSPSRRPQDFVGIAAFLFGLFLFVGCGGGGGGGSTGITTATTGVTSATTATSATTSTTAGGIAVTVSPSSVDMLVDDIQQFNATVTGTSNTSVIWSVLQGTDGGEIDNTGFYQAPSNQGNFTIVAASSADPSRTGTAQVHVRPGVNVIVNPQNVTIAKGQQVQFSATVENATNPAVEWSILAPNGVDGGTITQSGLYTAPQTVGIFNIMVESVEDPDHGWDLATVTVQ